MYIYICMCIYIYIYTHVYTYIHTHTLEPCERLRAVLPLPLSILPRSAGSQQWCRRDAMRWCRFMKRCDDADAREDQRASKRTVRSGTPVPLRQPQRSSSRWTSCLISRWPGLSRRATCLPPSLPLYLSFYLSIYLYLSVSICIYLYVRVSVSQCLSFSFCLYPGDPPIFGLLGFQVLRISYLYISWF